MAPETISAYHQIEPYLLIVLGKNIGVDSTAHDIRQRHDHLSIASRIIARAAGELWRPGMDIIFSTGQTAGPDIISEAAAQCDYIKTYYPEIPRIHLLTEENSVDTASNAREIAKLDLRRYKGIGLVTVGYHLENAKTLFENWGVKIDDPYVAEDIARNHSDYYRDFIDKWLASKTVRSEYRREVWRRKLLHVDPKGRSLNLITKLTRQVWPVWLAR